MVGLCLANLESQILGRLRINGQYGTNHLHAIHLAGLAEQLVFGTLDGLCLERLNFFLHGVVLVNVLTDDTLQVFRVVEEATYCLEGIFNLVQQFFALLARLGLYAADAGCHAALRDNLEETDATGRAGMNTATELTRRTEANDANLVAILLAEQGDGTQLLGLLEGHVTMFVKRNVLTNHVVHHTLHLT